MGPEATDGLDVPPFGDVADELERLARLAEALRRAGDEPFGRERREYD